MAKKANLVFVATIVKNTEKGGAWLAEYTIQYENLELPSTSNAYSAWANAGAAKRWIKAMVQAHTPRRAVKFVEGQAKDDKGKAVMFTGSVTYKAEA